MDGYNQGGMDGIVWVFDRKLARREDEFGRMTEGNSAGREGKF